MSVWLALTPGLGADSCPNCRARCLHGAGALAARRELEEGSAVHPGRAREVEFRGPGEMLLWGAKREYMWYPRDGFFVRSPVRFNGVAISESERETYEQNFLKADQKPGRARERRRKRDRWHRRRGAIGYPEPHSANPRAAVRVIGVSAEIQIRRRAIRAGRSRDDRQADRPAYRILPDQALLGRPGNACRGESESGGRTQVEGRRVRSRNAAAHEQSFPGDDLGRTEPEANREIHVRQRRFWNFFLPRGSCESPNCART